MIPEKVIENLTRMHTLDTMTNKARAKLINKRIGVVAITFLASSIPFAPEAATAEAAMARMVSSS